MLRADLVTGELVAVRTAPTEHSMTEVAPTGDGDVLVWDVGPVRTDAPPYLPAVIDWVGERLLVSDRWEDRAHGLVDPWGTLPTAMTTLGAETSYDNEAACAFDDGTVARSTWQTPYAEQQVRTGNLVRVDPDGTVVADYGVDLVSSSIACLTDGRIAVADNSGAADEIGRPRRLSIVTPNGDGTSDVQLLAEGDYGISLP